MKLTLSPLRGLLALESEGGDVSAYIEHNVVLWRRVNGALETLTDEALLLEARPESWFRTSNTG